MPKLSVILPCWGRPERTRRMIECILAQDTPHRWEAFIIGDGCPHFQNLIDSGDLQIWANQAEVEGNKINFFNLEKNYGGHGYYIMNYAVENAKGEYLIWVANDDMIEKDHFSNYLQINNTPHDFMYFDSWLDPTSSIRNAQLGYCQIGHSEIIVKTEVAKKLPRHGSHYGHDWDFINALISNASGVKAPNPKPTYKVMSIPAYGTKDVID